MTIAGGGNKTHPDNYIAVQGIGSTAGITMVNKGVADIGTAHAT